MMIFRGPGAGLGIVDNPQMARTAHNTAHTKGT
jgi:hypothetical protein